MGHYPHPEAFSYHEAFERRSHTDRQRRLVVGVAVKVVVAVVIEVVLGRAAAGGEIVAGAAGATSSAGAGSGAVAPEVVVLSSRW